jgi:hypothetical protein
MTRSRHAFRLAALAAVTLSLGLAAGCGRNHSGTVLSPAVLRPGPLVYTGEITGAVLFNSPQAPDLAVGPFPPTRVELIDKAVQPPKLLAVDTVGPLSRVYRFTHVKPGLDSINISSRAFYSYAITDIPASDGYLDAGISTLTINSTALSSQVELIGTIPGYTIDQLGMGTAIFEQNPLGIYLYPNLLYLDYFLPPPSPIPAGTYRFKFVTDGTSTANNLIGWGGSAAEVLTVPVTSRAMILGSGPATDLVVHFPTTAFYAFTLDERRQRFSIRLATTPASSFARR